MILSFWAMGIAWFWLVWSNLLNDHKVYHVHWFNEWHSELQILEHGGRKSTMYFSNTHSELFTTSSRWYQRPHKIKHAFDLLIIIPIFFCKEKTTSFPTLCLKISIYPNSNSNANITEHSLTKKKKKDVPLDTTFIPINVSVPSTMNRMQKRMVPWLLKKYSNELLHLWFFLLHPTLPKNGKINEETHRKSQLYFQ